MGSLGAPELLIIFLFWIVPFVVLYRVAGARRQSRSYAFWGLLGLIGMVIGLLIMIAMPQGSSSATGAGEGGGKNLF